MFWTLYDFAVSLIRFYFRFIIKEAQNISIDDQAITTWLQQKKFDKTIQFHCASLGEYEIALSIANEFQDQHDLVFTFFSKSGFHHAKLPEGALKLYLPLDQKTLVEEFIDQVNASLVVLIKYEFWLRYLQALDNRKIPFCFINIESQKVPFLLRFKKAQQLVLQAFSLFFSNKTSLNLFKNKGFSNLVQTIDLRLIRANHVRLENYVPPAHLVPFLERNDFVVCGSTWKEDEVHILKFINQNPSYKFIIAPHQVDRAHILEISKELKTHTLWSDQTQAEQISDTIIVDTIGALKYLYRYGKVAYIGGAFRTGIHNVVEAVAYNIPVIFGPNYSKDPFAVQMIEQKKAISFKSYDEFEKILLHSLKAGIQNSQDQNELDAQIEKDLQHIVNKIKSHL